MADSVLLTSLRDRILQKADMQNSTFVSSTELDAVIDEAAAELYDQLASAEGADYFAKPHTFTTTAGTDTYALPADFYRLKRVRWMMSSSKGIPLRRASVDALDGYDESQGWFEGYHHGTNARYRIEGDSLVFVPIPRAVHTVKLVYLPPWDRAATNMDVRNGWELYLIYAGVIHCVLKEEGDPKPWMQLRDEQRARIALSLQRDPEPEYMQDVDPYGVFYDHFLRVP
jgi:hypothetical protein